MRNRPQYGKYADFLLQVGECSRYTNLIANFYWPFGQVGWLSVLEVIFASTKSWQEIGGLQAGQDVVAAGPPEMVDAYTMVPLRVRILRVLKTCIGN